MLRQFIALLSPGCKVDVHKIVTRSARVAVAHGHNLSSFNTNLAQYLDNPGLTNVLHLEKTPGLRCFRVSADHEHALLYRLKVGSTFYQEFKEPVLVEANAETKPTSAGPPAGNAIHAALTFKDLEAQVAKAVTSVIGASVQPDQPLVAAGLDSLGEPAQCL